MKGDGFRKEELLPVPAVASEDAGDIAFINGGSLFQNRLNGRMVFGMQDDLSLFRQGYQGIRDNKGRKEGVCSGTDRAFDSADGKADNTGSLLEGSGIIAMYYQTAGMSAGTGKLVELQGGNEGIV